MRLSGPAVVRRWNKEWALVAMDLAQDRHAWSAAVRDAVHAMDADYSRPDEPHKILLQRRCPGLQLS